MSAPLHEALERLRQEFPDANLRDARLEFRLGERQDIPSTLSETAWNKFYWSIQINNHHGSGETFDECVAEVKSKVAREAVIPGYAKRIADILRELEYHDRYAATEAAHRLMEQEMRRQ